MDNNNSYFELTIAGLGGQGALTIGRLLAEAGMSQYKYVSYFPNYGASMRGGESECTIVLSNDEISAPAILNPVSVILMGAAPLQEFEKRVRPGGMIMLDSSLVTRKVEREDLQVVYLPATKAARDLGSNQVANFIFLGAYLEVTKAVPLELVEQALEKKLGGGRREALLALDKQALKQGMRLVSEGVA